MASLDRPEQKPDVTRADFKAWVEKYLLLKCKLTCDADDLYGARCGLVHSYSSESRTSREGRARTIYYAWGEADETQTNAICKAMGMRVATLHFNELFKGLLLGCHAFCQDVLRDEEKKSLVLQRLDKFFTHVAMSDVSAAYEAIKKQMDQADADEAPRA